MLTYVFSIFINAKLSDNLSLNNVTFKNIIKKKSKTKKYCSLSVLNDYISFEL